MQPGSIGCFTMRVLIKNGLSGVIPAKAVFYYIYSNQHKTTFKPRKFTQPP